MGFAGISIFFITFAVVKIVRESENGLLIKIII